MRDVNNYEDYEDFATEYYNEVVERLKNVCEKKEYSQGAISSKTGIPQSTISKLFSGEIKFSLSHIAKFCKALEIDPGEILAFSQKVPYECSIEEHNSNDMLLFNPSHGAFKGYMGEFNIYFASTVSSENTILHGIMKFTSSENKKECKANLKLYTGKIKNDEKITKNYTGNLIISLSMSSCYCILMAKDIGEMCFLVFDHMFLINEDLSCRLACVITTSAGGNRRPTMHRLLLCRDELDISSTNTKDYKFLQSHLRLNSSDIVISKASFSKLKENEIGTIKNSDVKELLNIFTSQSEESTFYKIDESLIRNTPYSMETKVELLTLLREYSIEKRYNKISSKADEYAYNYLSNRNN